MEDVAEQWGYGGEWGWGDLGDELGGGVDGTGSVPPLSPTHPPMCVIVVSPHQGPEFVRKHIFNKHGEKMGAVRKEVLFFNNFLMDPKRPALPEGKGGPPPGPAQGEFTPPGDSVASLGTPVVGGGLGTSQCCLCVPLTTPCLPGSPYRVSDSPMSRPVPPTWPQSPLGSVEGQ